MFEDNMKAIQRLVNQESVVLAVVVPDRKPIRTGGMDTGVKRGLIVACPEEPLGQHEIAILGSVEIDQGVFDMRPIGEKVEVYDDSMHHGILCSVVRGYASMMTALGMTVMVPVRMETETLKRWKERRKQSKGGWLVVQKPGIGNQPAEYKSSNEPPDTDIGLQEFDPTSPDTFHAEMEIMNEADLLSLLEATDTDISFGKTLDPKHDDAVFWRMLHGDLEKEPETPQDNHPGSRGHNHNISALPAGMYGVSPEDQKTLNALQKMRKEYDDYEEPEDLYSYEKFKPQEPKFKDSIEQFRWKLKNGKI